VEKELEMERNRRAMVEAIAQEVAETASWLGRAALSEEVMTAMAEVPRHEFVNPAQRLLAYLNRPLPIGHGQTISQPYMVAVMTDLAGVGPSSRVLEVGTGCGYQAAVLGALGARVTSVELVPELAAQAAERLERLGYDGVTVHQGDGSKGWPAGAPYDAIVVTAAAFGRVPEALLEQLAPGGRLVIPVEQRGTWRGRIGFGADQELFLIEKDQAGTTSQRSVLPVAFVPLIERG